MPLEFIFRKMNLRLSKSVIIVMGRIALKAPLPLEFEQCQPNKKLAKKYPFSSRKSS